MKRTRLKRKTPLRPKRPTPRQRRPVVRLTGLALLRLRYECWRRAQGRSELSGKVLHYQAWFDGDPQAYDMAHLKSRGAGGSDALENVMALTHEEHMAAHQGKIALPKTYSGLVGKEER